MEKEGNKGEEWPGAGKGPRSMAPRDATSASSTAIDVSATETLMP
jgi:hypothetical protein